MNQNKTHKKNAKCKKLQENEEKKKGGKNFNSHSIPN